MKCTYRKICCLMFVLPLLIMTPQANAGIWHKSTINMAYPTEDGDFIIRLTQSHADCVNTNKFYTVEVGKYGVTIEGVKKMYAAVLTAATSQKEVEINYDPEGTQCYINRLKVFF